MLPFGEWKPDLMNTNGGTSQLVQNVVPRADGYGPFGSFVAFSAALPVTCRGHFYAHKTDGSIVVFAGTATRLFKLNNTDFSRTDVSKSGLAYPALSSFEHW